MTETDDVPEILCDVEIKNAKEEILLHGKTFQRELVVREGTEMGVLRLVMLLLPSCTKMHVVSTQKIYTPQYKHPNPRYVTRITWP